MRAQPTMTWTSEPRAVGRDRDVGPRLRVGVLGPHDRVVLPTARRARGGGRCGGTGRPSGSGCRRSPSRRAPTPRCRPGSSGIASPRSVPSRGVEHAQHGVLAAALAGADGDQRAVGRGVEPVDGVGRVGGADGRVEQDDGRRVADRSPSAGSAGTARRRRGARGRTGGRRGPAPPSRPAAASTRRGARATAPDRGGRRAPDGCARSGRRPTAGPRRRHRPPASGTGRGPRRRGGCRRRPRAGSAGAASSTCWFGQPRPMLGRLPWLALERRSRALRFFVFFDIGVRVYGRAGGPSGTAGDRACTSARQGALDGGDERRVLGRDHRAEAGDRAVRGDEELLEVPADVAVVALGVGDLRSARRRSGGGRRR